MKKLSLARQERLGTLVTVATFPHVELAYLTRARLEVEGIPSFVFDEHMVTYNWLYLVALG